MYLRVASETSTGSREVWRLTRNDSDAESDDGVVA